MGLNVEFEKIEKIVETAPKISVVTEKNSPDVPLAAGLDVAAFGDDPLFVTLPVAQIGAVSRNGYRYAEAAVRGLVEQINAKKPEGRWGHVRLEDRETYYAAPAVRWVGAILDEATGVVWGKAVAITPEAREHFRVANAAQAVVGTSLYGVATIEGDEVIALDLESIDLADAARVGIVEAVATPVITAEMVKLIPSSAIGSNPMANIEGTPMNGADEISADEMPSVRQLIMEQAGVLRQVGIEPEADTLAIVRGLIGQVAQLQAERLLSEIQSVITETVKLAPLRPIIAEMLGVPSQFDGENTVFVSRWRGVIQEMGGAADPVAMREAVRGQVVEMLQKPHVQAIARALVSELAGPGVMVGVHQPHPLVTAPQNGRVRGWDTPENRAEARSRFGF